MEFHREKFIEETLGDYESAMEVIDALTNIIGDYILSDEISKGYGGGCYSEPKKEIQNMLNLCEIAEFFDI